MSNVPSSNSRTFLSVLIATAVAAIIGIQSGCSTTVTDVPSALHSESRADPESEAVIATVHRFWDLALRGDREQSKELIVPPDKSFWARCTLQRKDTASDDNALGSGSAPIAGHDPNENLIGDPRYFTSGLTIFWEQLLEKKPELVRAELDKLSGNEAVVRIRWRKKGSDFRGFDDYFLLQKIDDGWKIILMKSSNLPHPSIENFASGAPCSP